MLKHAVKTLASGEYSCSCGAVWDRDEGDECPNSETPLQLGTRLHAEAQEAMENGATMRQFLGAQTLTDEICAALTQRDQPALAYRQKLAARLRAAGPVDATADDSEELPELLNPKKPVVLPERMSEPRPIWAAAPYVGRPLNGEEITEARAYNAALAEVARLNSSPVSAVYQCPRCSTSMQVDPDAKPFSAGGVDERAAFEAWRLEKFCGGVERLKKCSNAPDIHYYTAEQEAWKTWQAHAALSAPSHGEQVRDLPPFANKVISKLRRVDACFSESQPTYVGRHWLELLTQLGLLNRVQRSPGLWEISQQGEDLLAAAPSAGSQGGDV